MSAGAAVAVAALAAIAAAAVVLWLAVGWLGAWRLNHPPAARGPRSEFTFTPLETDVPHEIARFRAADGPELHGWFLPRPESSRVILAMHGYRGEMSQVLGISTLLWRAGWNVLLFDFRGRGRSDPAPISMGVWETADLAAALEWIEARVEEPRVALFGFSMGAVVALLAGAHPRVGAIVADSAFASQRDVLEHFAERDGARLLGGRLDGRRFLPAVEWWHRRRGKPPFDAIAPLAAVAGLDGTPVLLIHGRRDTVVPVEQARRLAEAAGSAELWEVEEAQHCGAYFVDRGAYMGRVTAFLDRAMPPGAA
ncbi:MAG TPA: alpha/beta fold hydrolase [Gemmatimonadota bacterium]|nr:alpha/beta fold hydrolase [Gemmatimonadota bacterium]